MNTSNDAQPPPVTIQCPYTATNCPLFNPTFTDADVLSANGRAPPDDVSPPQTSQQSFNNSASGRPSTTETSQISYNDYSLAPISNNPPTPSYHHLSDSSRGNSPPLQSPRLSYARSPPTCGGGCGGGAATTRQSGQQLQTPVPLGLNDVKNVEPRSRSVERDLEDLFEFYVPPQPVPQLLDQKVPLDAHSPSTASSVDSPPSQSYASHHAEVVTPFISKLSHLLSHPEYSDFIRWTPAGDAFVFVHTSPALLDLFARFFRHANLHSFIRQLNIYGFVRLTTLSLLSAIDSLPYSPEAVQYSAADYSGFAHPLFFRDSAAARCDLSAIKPKTTKSNAPRKASAPRSRKPKAEEGGVGKAPRRKVSGA